MPRGITASGLVRIGVGLACVAVLFVAYMATAPPLLRLWEAGVTRPTPANGWYEWPQWQSALLVSTAGGLVFAAATRLGASAIWAASASLSCGFGWALWMVAVVPSAKSVAMLLVGAGLLAVAHWASAALKATPARLPRWGPLKGPPYKSAGETRAPGSSAALTGTHYMALVAGVVLLLGGARVQSLLPPSAGVRMSTSPADIVRALAGELRLLAFIVAAVGVVELWSRSRRAAIALGAVIAAYCLLAGIVGVSPEAALLPASLPVWVAVAFGLEWIVRVGPRPAALALSLVLALLMPGERWLMNHTLIHRAAAPFFPGSLALSLAAIPAQGTLLSNGQEIDRRIGRAAAVLPVGPFRVAPASTWTPDAHSSEVLAFHGTRDEVAPGHTLRTVPKHVPLSAFLRMLPDDNIVAIALTPVAASTLSRERPGYFAGIGAPEAANAAQTHAFVGRARAASGALVQQHPEAVRIALPSGAPWGEPVRPSPISLEVVADRNVAAIAVEGREILRVPHGGALIVTSREGLLQLAYVITAEQRLLMPVPADEWSLGLVDPVKSDPPRPDPFFAHRFDMSALVRFDGRDHAYFSSGWHLPERDGVIEYMWTSEATSHLAIPLTEALELKVIIELRPAVADDRDPPMVVLHVNGVRFERQALPGRRMYEWRVPAEAWRAGVNDVAIELTRVTRPLGSHDQRLLGAAVSLFRLERLSR